MYSIDATKYARKDARIIAFEPHPITYRRLKYNAQMCSRHPIESLQIALGEDDGEARLSANDLSLSSVVDGGELKVSMRKLSTCLSDLRVEHIDAIKIDVEGYEDQVLAGFLESAPDSLMPELVIIEHLEREGWERDCISMLRRRGLEVFGGVKNNTFLARPGTDSANSLSRMNLQ